MPSSVEEYSFNINEVVNISDVKWPVCDSIYLDTANNSILASNSSFLIDGDDIFAYNQERIFHYDKHGKYLNSMGKTGHGKNEYIELVDVALDKRKKLVEVLSVNRILKYDYTGKYVGDAKFEEPFSSFLHLGNQYWFSSGRRLDHLTYKSDEKLQTIEGCMVLDKKMKIPMMEKNFSISSIVAFHESFSHDIYHIENNQMIWAYHLIFQNLEIPEEIYGPTEEIMDVLTSKHFAVIQKCLENEQFLYVLVNEYNSGENELYHWIINKATRQSKIIRLNKVSPESYHVNPVTLTEDNRILFLGYNIYSEEKYNNGVNPSIISVDISKLW